MSDVPDVFLRFDGGGDESDISTYQQVGSNGNKHSSAIQESFDLHWRCIASERGSTKGLDFGMKINIEAAHLVFDQSPIGNGEPFLASQALMVVVVKMDP